jgi:hypothetical protein
VGLRGTAAGTGRRIHAASGAAGRTDRTRFHATINTEFTIFTTIGGTDDTTTAEQG